MCMGVKYSYQNNRMDRSEYIMINISTISQELIDKYNFKDKLQNGYIFRRLTKGIYGLSQAGRITQDYIVQHLEPYVCHPSNNTP